MMWFHHQPSKKTQLTCDNWTKYRKIAANVSKTTLLTVLLGLGCDFLVTRAAIAQNAPQSDQAQARPARMNLAVNRQPQETYESLMNRAETVAITAVKQRFSQDKHAPAVSVMIVAHSYGAIAPVLSLEVSRNQWQYSKAETKDQMKYFSTAKMLLGFDGTASSNSDQPQTSQATPEITPEMEQIDRFIRESDAKSESAPEEIPDGETPEAPAVVPVETPTPELPTIIPGETSVPENSTLPSDSIVPSPAVSTTVPENGSMSPSPTLQQNSINSIPVPTDGALPENTIPNISDVVPEDNQD
ncbi:hypothetical protein IQ230_17385 [Gloeocapsopsis crepidinum LEGE 06123]|uniref:Uncharacterized protein n=1 Tax=Gloeocapsopsis crepidinum LEGE 06123 TaxID=588587 RepID=A0ABR9UUV9_9CHRO|nr:hypothetical protein [Gloeocapsopsis crepidinum]MBE9192093.1 hypothetical protein [Gloeocapsopsis crepidinum LEGE 06123]